MLTGYYTHPASWLCGTLQWQGRECQWQKCDGMHSDYSHHRALKTLGISLWHAGPAVSGTARVTRSSVLLEWDVRGAQRMPPAPENMNYAICTFQLFALNWPSRVWNPAQISPCYYAVECRNGKRKLISCHAFYSLWSNRSDLAR